MQGAEEPAEGWEGLCGWAAGHASSKLRGQSQEVVGVAEGKAGQGRCRLRALPLRRAADTACAACQLARLGREGPAQRAAPR